MIKSKKIFLTGGSSGLGRALLEILLKNNNEVYNLSRSKIIKKKLKSEVCDFKNIQNIKHKLKKLINIKKIDYVILNAGILGKIKKIDKINSKEIEEIFRINVLANKEIIDFFISKKIKANLIVGISTGAALAPKYGWYPYCSSKAAFKFLLESYALEKPKMKFLSISPGLIKTKMQKQIHRVNEKKISSVKKFKKLYEQNKIPSPHEVATNIINTIKKVNKKSGSYIDIR